MNGACAIEGCESTGKHRLGLRCRVMHGASPISGKGKTDALWSAESTAYLCDVHALSGLDVTLLISKNESGYACIRTVSGPRSFEPRRVKIKQEAES
jgi:hypothetical protein